MLAIIVDKEFDSNDRTNFDLEVEKNISKIYEVITKAYNGDI